MADFSVQVAKTPPDVETLQWTDPAIGSAPSRLNIAGNVAHRYWRVMQNTTITFEAIVGGVVAPADGALGGRLIKWAWVEHARQGLASPPAIVTPVGGKSSVAEVTPSPPGHYTIQAWRENGGSVLIPFEVELAL